MIDKQSDRHERQKQDRIAYVITRGNYSDYEICAVTLDAELAGVLRDKFNNQRWLDARIEEWNLDEFMPIKEGADAYRITFENDGGISGMEKCDIDTCREPVAWANTYMHKLEGDMRVVVHVIAKDEYSAVKIAAEKRAEFVALEMGIG